MDLVQGFLLFRPKAMAPLSLVEVVERTPIWVKLLVLLLELWEDPILMTIKKLLGKVVKVDESYKTSVYCSVVRVLVDVNIRKGLFEPVEVILGDHVYNQILYYVSVPFHYSNCHTYVHILRYFNSPFILKFWRRKVNNSLKFPVGSTIETLVIFLFDSEKHEFIRPIHVEYYSENNGGGHTSPFT